MRYGIGDACGDCDSAHHSPYFAFPKWKNLATSISSVLPSSYLMQMNLLPVVRVLNVSTHADAFQFPNHHHHIIITMHA